MDIHRPENFNYNNRLKNVIDFGNKCIKKYKVPVKILYFKRLVDRLKDFNLDLDKIEMINLLPYKEYLQTVYDSLFIISDSGTGQEEPALLNTPVIVPRDFTERPQSYENNCSFKLKINDNENNTEEVFEWIEKSLNGELRIDTNWLGNGETSKLVTDAIKNFFV